LNNFAASGGEYNPKRIEHDETDVHLQFYKSMDNAAQVL
jgi:hypothetical protein